MKGLLDPEKLTIGYDYSAYIICIAQIAPRPCLLLLLYPETRNVHQIGTPDPEQTIALAQVPWAHRESYIEIVMDVVQKHLPTVQHVLILHTDLPNSWKRYSPFHYGAIVGLYEAKLPAREVQQVPLDIRPMLETVIPETGCTLQESLLQNLRTGKYGNAKEWTLPLDLPLRLRYTVMLEHASTHAAGASIYAELPYDSFKTESPRYMRVLPSIRTGILTLNALIHHYGTECVPFLLDDIERRLAEQNHSVPSYMEFVRLYVDYQVRLNHHWIPLHPVIHDQPIFNLGTFLWSSTMFNRVLAFKNECAILARVMYEQRFAVHLRASQAISKLATDS